MPLARWFRWWVSINLMQPGTRLISFLSRNTRKPICSCAAGCKRSASRRRSEHRKENTMIPIDPIYVGNDAISKLIEYIDQKKLQRFTILCDDNTYRALAERVEQALKAHGATVTIIKLTGAEIIADERYLIQVLVN